MQRRKFIQLGIGLAAAAALPPGCSSNTRTIKGKIVGANSSAGHLLRDKQFAAPAITLKKEMVIVGGGVSGLTAAWHLQQQGIKDYLLLELENKPGGNSVSGENNISAYPWAAHYIPLPNNDLPEYLEFLQQCGVVTGVDAAGLPVYNETHLCFDPQERLYINGRWQDGLVPQFGLPAAEIKQVEDFLKQMNEYRYKKGSDGKDAFAIPVNNSSTDAVFLALDNMTMLQWMQQNGFTSKYLHEYVNYCSRDDFGTPHNKASAWAGIHYYASRKGKGANAHHSDVLTWPEGNGFLVKALMQHTEEKIQKNALVTRIATTGNGIQVDYYDVLSAKTTRIEAKQCIVSVPQFVAARLLAEAERSQKVKQYFHYAPWMVANLTVNNLKERSGVPLSWDNVLHGSYSLGYVNATQQLQQQDKPRRNLTYYQPLTSEDPVTERTKAQNTPHAQWVEMILADLEKVHPNIRSATEEINIMLWGHAMIQPLPGSIFGAARKELSASINNRIHFAHTDIAGISIFEEAFYQGLNAAKKALAATA